MGGLAPSDRSSTSAPLVELRDVSKRFGGVHALAGISLEIPAGTVHALVGENGAGKSTLAKIVAGAIPHDSGELLVDGRPVKSCTMLAVQVDGRAVATVESLAGPSELHPLQEGFRAEHGLQCGFCTPGMMMAASALLAENSSPTEDEVRWALSGNLCRCTGYQNIVKSVLWAAEKLRSASAG